MCSSMLFFANALPKLGDLITETVAMSKLTNPCNAEM